MKLRFTILFAILLHFIGVLPIIADNENNSSLLERCEHHRSTSDYNSLKIDSRKLIQLATANHDDRSLGYAEFYQGLSLLFTGHGKQSLDFLDKAWDISRDIKNDTIGALVMNARGIYQALNENNRYLAQKYFFKSLDLAKAANDERLKVRVYGNLLVLSGNNADSTSLDYAQKVYQFGKSHQDIEQASTGAYYLALHHYQAGNSKKALEYVQVALNYYKELPYDDIASVYTLYSQIEMKENHLDDARKLAIQSVELAEEHKQISLLPAAYLQLATVENKQGNYAESNISAQKAIKLSGDFSLANKIIECYQLIANNCVSLGDKDGAIKYLQLANKQMSTLSSVNMDRLMNERAIMDEMQKKEAQAEMQQQQAESRLRISILLLVILVIVVVSFILFLRNYRNRMRLTKRIVAQNTSYIEQLRYMRNRITALESTNELSSEEHNSGVLLNDDDRVNLLFDQLCDLMDNKQIYKESQLNRERLASMLGTNRTYLSNVIKAKSGQGYQQFVNNYRITEAMRILSDPERINYPLKQIWSDLGFSSASTFYKLFLQQVGITPSVYRRQYAKISEAEESEEDLDP